MRLTIEHTTRYTYETPPTSVIEVLRLTPASTATQTVRRWRIDVTGDAVLKRGEDAFGNITHTFTATDPGDTLSIVATGVLETEITNGIVFGTRERLPLGVFLRPTPLTEAESGVRDLAAGVRARADGSAIDLAHKLNLAVHAALDYVPGTTDVATSAADALRAGGGVCQDLAHVLIAAARASGMPARYVSGYRYDAERDRGDHDPHAWAEIFVQQIGWITFDPTVGASATNSYARVAVGLDYLSASPVRGAVTGGSGETLVVSVVIDGSGWHLTQSLDDMSQSLDGSQTIAGPLGTGMIQTPGHQSMTSRGADDEDVQ